MKRLILIVMLCAVMGCARFKEAADYELTEAEVELVEKVEEKVEEAVPFPWDIPASVLVGMALGYGISWYRTRKKEED